MAICMLQQVVSTRLLILSYVAGRRANHVDFASLDEVAQMPLNGLTEWLDKKGKRRFVEPERNARRLQQVARAAFDLSAELHSVLHDPCCSTCATHPPSAFQP
jgi:hypothetical protein